MTARIAMSAVAAATVTTLLALTGCGDRGGTADGPAVVAPGGGTGASADGAADGAAGGAAACVAGLTLQGTFYLHVDAGPVTPGRALPGAEVPPCNDTGGDEEQATPIETHAIDGVDPRYAVVAEGGAGPMVYVARAHAPGLRDAEPLPADVATALGLD